MSNAEYTPPRIFVLGAGFSKHAGLPLGADLFHEIRRRASDRLGKVNWLEEDMAQFIEFKQKCDGIFLAPEEINFEEFISFLDIEHYLGLRGSKTYSDEGNESQVIIKKYIGKIIQERTPRKDLLPEAYYRFAEYLSLDDIIVSFNYDVILERALEHVGKPYRLFPNRFSKIGKTVNFVDNSIKEVILLKMHGSVDWFSRESYERLELDYKEQKFLSQKPPDPIFNNTAIYKPYPLLDGPQSPNDPLLKIYRIRLVDDFYSTSFPQSAPFILAPSSYKIIYSSPLKDFWYGLNYAGIYNASVSIIGFSMPAHDEYLKQFIYRLITNYQGIDKYRDFSYKKSKLKLIDFKTSEKSVLDYKMKYNFIDWANVEAWFEGFDKKAVLSLYGQRDLD